MVFGWGRRTAGAQETAVLADAGLVTEPSAAAVLTGSDVSDVAWAPLPADDASKQFKEPLPYQIKQHDVKSRLQDRSTAQVDVRAVVSDAPHDVMFDLLADPHQHERIFDAIESASAELVSEEGPVRRWRLDYRARWKFWKVGGVCDNRLWMTTDRERGTVSFALREPGFLRRYEGTWTITGPHGGGPAARDGTTSPSPSSSSPSPSPATGPLRKLWIPNLDSNTPSASNPTTPRQNHHPGSGPVTPAAFSSITLSTSRSSSPSNLSSPSLSASSPSTPLDTPRGSSPGGGVAGFLAALPNPFQNSASHSTSPSDSPSSLTPAGAPGASARVGPRTPTTITVTKLMSPKVSPPFPINQVLKGHAAGQVHEMMEGLLRATARKVEEEGGTQGRGQAAFGRQVAAVVVGGRA